MNVRLRPARTADLPLLLAWRSNPRIYEHFRGQEGPLVWESHVRWWESRRDRKDWIIVVEDTLGGRPVGSIYATDLDQEAPELGLYIGEVSAWGKGIAFSGPTPRSPPALQNEVPQNTGLHQGRPHVIAASVYQIGLLLGRTRG